MGFYLYPTAPCYLFLALMNGISVIVDSIFDHNKPIAMISHVKLSCTVSSMVSSTTSINHICRLKLRRASLKGEGL